ncbi:MAG: hypothetical protein PWQ95_774 [Thermococcaceae archaeon]|nr:hypothetical protein [Thermococcaceae archaeon]
MKLPTKQPLKENVVVTSREEFLKLLEEALSGASGAFAKILGRNEAGKYYITVLFDRSKVLAAEGLLIDEKKELVGKDALEVLPSVVNNPMVVDVYSLDELETKLSIADNVDVYSQTPQIPISELFGVEVTEEKPEAPVEVEGEKTVVEKKAKVEERKPPVEAKKPETKKPEEKKSEEVPKAKKPQEKPKAPVQIPKEPQVVVNLKGEKLPEEAFKHYAEAILRDAKRIKNVTVYKIEFDSEAGEGVTYLKVRVYGVSEASSREIEIAEKRLLHSISQHAPIILRETGFKPILQDSAVIINGEEIKPQEIVEADKKKSGKVTPDGRITMSVLEDVWPYFSAYAKTVATEIESSGIKIEKAYFDIKGRREFEINLYASVRSTLPETEVESRIRSILTKHARELGRTINRYITVHKVEVELPKVAPATPGSVPVSAKASEILAKKEDLEKEVEKLLKAAGIDEFSFLTEEKKEAAKETFLKSKVEPALEKLRERIYEELRQIPRGTLKWLKIKHTLAEDKVILDIEVSFLQEQTSALFGSFSGVSEERLRREISEAIQKAVRDVSRDYGVSMRIGVLNIILR